MSARLRAPVLTVDAAEMRKVDPRNVETLFGMWTVFSKCAEAMEEGRRYENLSWRLWNRETFCCTSPNVSARTSAHATPVPTTRATHRRVPSVESAPTGPSTTRSPSSSSSSSSPPASRSRASSPARRRAPIAPRRSRRRASPPSPTPGRTRAPTDDLPELSASVDSAISDRDDDDDDDGAPEAVATTPLDIEHPAIRRLDSFESRSRGQERHLTSVHLERMFSSIKARTALRPLDPSTTPRTVGVRSGTAERSAREPPPQQQPQQPQQPQQHHRPAHPPPPHVMSNASTTTTTTQPLAPATADLAPATSPPARHPPASRTPDGAAAADIPGATATATATGPATKKTMFVFGSSSGEEEEESSLDDHMRAPPGPRMLPRGALADGSTPGAATTDRKQTSFSDAVVTRTIRDGRPEDSDAVTTDDDEDADANEEPHATPAPADDGDVRSESAIDEDDEDEDEDEDDDDLEEVDDSSDWDSITESGRSSPDEKPLFQRVDSSRTLTSRRSLLTNLLHQSQRAAAFAAVASRSTPARAPAHRVADPASRIDALASAAFVATDEDEDAVDDDDDDDTDEEAVVEDEDEDEPSRPDRSRRHRPGLAVGQATDLPRSRPIIMTTSNAHPPALSPRTTRRNMLATELTESLRKHLLWERQQKHPAAQAGLRRRHTAHDVAHLQDYPPEPRTREPPSSKNNSWNHYYYDLGLGQYHQKGW